MLHARFRRSRTPVLELSRWQERVAERIREKTREGVYAFEETQCPVCEDDDFEPVAAEDRYGLKHPVVICRDCGLIQASPRMTNRSFEHFYDTDYRLLYNGTTGDLEPTFEAQQEKARRQYQFLEDVLPGLESASVLEVGTGPGGILAHFRERGHDVRGCDLSEPSSRFAREVAGLEVEQGRVSDLEIDDPPDLILLSHIIEHFLDPIGELEAISEIAGEDTVVYVETPGIYDVPFSYDSDFKKLLQNAHTYYFTLTSLRNLMHQAGFQIVRGTEKIRSLFQPATSAVPPVDNDYDEAMNYLSTLARTASPPVKARLKMALDQHVAPVAGEVLRRVGAYDAIAGTYRQFYEA